LRFVIGHDQMHQDVRVSRDLHGSPAAIPASAIPSLSSSIDNRAPSPFPVEHPAQRLPGAFGLFRFELGAAIRQQVQPDLAARLDAEMLQYVFSEGDLTPCGDGQNGHGNPSPASPLKVMQNSITINGG
jgi:hypothetical protein